MLFSAGTGPDVGGSAVTAVVQAVSTPVAGDVSGTGRDDLVVLNAAGQILYRQALPGAQPTYAPAVVVNPASEPACAICLVHAGSQTYLAALDAQTQQQRIVLYACNTATGGLIAVAGLELSDGAATAMTAGDLTGDGRDDLVVVSSTLDQVRVFDQQPDGTFFATPNVTATVAGSPSSVTLAPVDGSGRLDIVTTDLASDDVCVLINTPDGTFRRQERYSCSDSRFFPLDASTTTPATPSALAPVALADGASSGLAVVESTGTAEVWSGGNGTGLDASSASPFVVPAGAAAVASGPTTSGSYWLAVLDTTTDEVLSYAPDASGQMQLVATLDAGNHPTGLSVQAVTLPDGQTRYDLLVGNAQGDVLRLVGNGDGTFQPYQRVLARITLAAADLTGNGVTDFIFANQGLDRVSILEGGQQQLLGDNLSGLFAPSAVLLTDLNGDGVPDLIVCNSGGDSVLVYPGLGNGAFGPELNGGQGFATGENPTALAVVQMTGESLPKLLVANKDSNDVSVLSVTGSDSGWTLTPVARLYAGPGPTSLLTADVYGKGEVDLIVTDGNGNQVRILPGNLSGLFDATAVRILPTGADPTKAFVGDFNGDGKLDLLTLDTAGNDLTYYPDIASPSSTGRQINSGGTGPMDGLVRTVNGKSDLIVANYTDGQVALFMASPDGPSYAGSLESPGGHPTALVANPSSSDPWSVYVADAGSESASAMNFDSLAENASSLLDAEAEKPYEPPQRGEEAALQPLKESTVDLIPTLVTSEEPVEAETDAPAPALPGKPATPIPSPGLPQAREDDPSEPTEEGTEQQTSEPGVVEEPGLQRFLLGAESTPAPAVGADGSTEEPRTVAPESRERTEGLLPWTDPWMPKQHTEAVGLEEATADRSATGRPVVESELQDMVLAAAMVGLAWQCRGEKDRWGDSPLPRQQGAV